MDWSCWGKEDLEVFLQKFSCHRGGGALEQTGPKKKSWLVGCWLRDVLVGVVVYFRVWSKHSHNNHLGRQQM